MLQRAGTGDLMIFLRLLKFQPQGSVQALSLLLCVVPKINYQLWLLFVECEWAKFVNDPTTSSSNVCVTFYAHLTKMYIIWQRQS